MKHFDRMAAGVAMCMVLAMMGCGGSQQPSPRVQVWDEDTVEEVSLSADKVVVPFTPKGGGCMEIQASLNGEPFNMLWDTGAAITSISALELQKLDKAGKITLDDLQGTIVAQIADGSYTEEYVFNLAEIVIPARDNQSLTLHDIEVCVSANMSAPLLVGQNVMRKLPRHTIDNAESVIIFEQQ